jgi:hypothetical protein
VRELVDEDVLAPVARIRIAEQVLLRSRRRVAAEAARTVGVVITIACSTGSSRDAPGRFIREYSGMSIVISTSAMTPVRQLRAIIALRKSGRIASIAVDDVAGDEQRRVGHLSDETTGMPCASTYFLVERIDAERCRHRLHLGLDVVGDELDRLTGLLSLLRPFLTMLLGQRPCFRLGALRSCRLIRRHRLVLRRAVSNVP